MKHKEFRDRIDFEDNIDEFPNMKVIVTGSSSLDLASKVSEPLTGSDYL